MPLLNNRSWNGFRSSTSGGLVSINLHDNKNNHDDCNTAKKDLMELRNDVTESTCDHADGIDDDTDQRPIVVVTDEMNDDVNEGGINNNKRNVDRLRQLVLSNIKFKKREQLQSSSISSINGKTLMKEPLVKLKNIITKGAKEVKYRTNQLQQHRQQLQQHQLYSPMKENEWYERSRYNSSDSSSMKSRRRSSSTMGIHGPTCQCDFCSTILSDTNFNTSKSKYLQFTPMDHERSIIENDDNYVPYFNDCSERSTKHRSCFYNSISIDDTSGTIDEYYSKSLIESLTNDNLKIGYSVDGSDAGDDDNYNHWDDDEEKDDTSRSHTYNGMVTIYEECDEDDDEDDNDSQSNSSSATSCTSFDDIGFAVYEQKQLYQHTTMPKQISECCVEDTFDKDSNEDDPSDPSATTTTTSSSSSTEDMDSWVLPLFPEASPYLNLNTFDTALPETMDSSYDHALPKRQRSLSSLSLLQFEESDDSDNSTSYETNELHTIPQILSNRKSKDDVVVDNVGTDNIQMTELMQDQRHDCTTMMHNETTQQEAESSSLSCSTRSELNESKAPRDGATQHLQESSPKLQVESYSTSRESIDTTTLSNTEINVMFSDEQNHDHEEMILQVSPEKKIQEISDEDKNCSVNEERENESATTTINNITGFAESDDANTVGCIHNHQENNFIVLDRLSVGESTSTSTNETTMSVVEEDVLSGDVGNNETTVVEADIIEMKNNANIEVKESTGDTEVLQSDVASIGTINATATNDNIAIIVETNEYVPIRTDHDDTATTETAVIDEAAGLPIESSASKASSSVSHDVATTMKDEIISNVAAFEHITEVIVENKGAEAGTTAVSIDATATNEDIATIVTTEESEPLLTDDNEAVRAETISNNAAVLTEYVTFEHNTELTEETQRDGRTTVPASTTKEPSTEAILLRTVSLLDTFETKDRPSPYLNNALCDIKDTTYSDCNTNLKTLIEGEKYDDKVETNNTVTEEKSHDQEEAETVNTVVFATLSEVKEINGETTGVRSVEENLHFSVNVSSNIAALSDQTETIVANIFIAETTSQNDKESVLIESNISKHGEVDGVNSEPRSILQFSSSCIPAGKRKKSVRWIDEEDEDDDEEFVVDDDYSINIDENDSCCCIIPDEKTKKKKSLVTIHPFPSWWHRKMSSKLSREEKHQKRKSKPFVERDRISL